MSTAAIRDAILRAVDERTARDRTPILTAERQREEAKRHDAMKYRRSMEAHDKNKGLGAVKGLSKLYGDFPTQDDIDSLAGEQP